MYYSVIMAFFLSSIVSPSIIIASPALAQLSTPISGLFSTPLVYIFPIALIIYSVIIFTVTDYELISKIKRIYYAVMLLLFTIVLKNVDFTSVCETGLFGTSAKSWSIILVSIIGAIIIVLIDSYIISGYVFKEFGFMGTKFIRDETAETVKNQHDYIFSLESSIKAQYELIEKIKRDFAGINSRRGKRLNFNEEIGKIIKEFYVFKTCIPVSPNDEVFKY